MNRFVTLSLMLLLVLLAGCEQRMAEQPHYEPLEASRMFADGSSARPRPDNTVARGFLRQDLHFFAGLRPDAVDPGEDAATSSTKVDLDRFATEFPFPITSDVMQRGRERFDIYCAACHGRAGYGEGAVVQRGFPPAQSFHQPRLRAAPAGYFFHVISHGFGKMPAYDEWISPRDRWSIVAYIRALQLSQHASIDQLPDSVRQRLSQTESAHVPAQDAWLWHPAAVPLASAVAVASCRSGESVH